MSDPSASPPPEPLIDEATWARAMRPTPFGPWWAPPEVMSVEVDDQGMPLSMDNTLRVREQAIHSAAMMVDVTPFPEEDAEKVVELAKRFEKFIRSGQ